MLKYAGDIVMLKFMLKYDVKICSEYIMLKYAGYMLYSSMQEIYSASTTPIDSKGSRTRLAVHCQWIQF